MGSTSVELTVSETGEIESQTRYLAYPYRSHQWHDGRFRKSLQKFMKSSYKKEVVTVSLPLPQLPNCHDFTLASDVLSDVGMATAQLR